jgi:hypothetical protein
MHGLVIPGFVWGAHMQKQITFSGAIQGQEIDTPPHPNTQSAYGSTTEIATHVGQLSRVLVLV